MKPLFLAFEGIDGSGKSTQAKLLAERMEKEGHSVFLTAEPTREPIGLLIRKIFKHEMEADHRTIAGLFIADRLDHLLHKENGILKKMHEGHTVISDRYYFSSFAYQGTHMDINWVIEANALSTQLLRPDLNIYIDISPEESMHRLHHGRDAKELYETEENLKNVRDKYFEAFSLLKDTENIFIVDGNRPAEFIADAIWKKVSTLLSEVKPV